MVIAVISGEGQVMFSPVSTAVPHGKTGKLRLLGVSSAARIASLPDVPAIGAIGKGYDIATYYSAHVPAGTPKDTVARLNGDILKALAQADEETGEHGSLSGFSEQVLRVT